MKKEISTFLVGGFLGAGKTTFILDQLKQSDARTAVLVNEFGQLGIDGELIRLKSGIEVVEMPGGCICCSQKQGLLDTVQRIVTEISPDRFLIEPSGVAETSEVLQVLSDPSLAGLIRLNAVITVIDAETFLEFSEPEAFGLFFLDQVKNADLIMANKADLVSGETLDAIEERVRVINPAALLVKTQYCRLEIPLPCDRQRDRESTKAAPLGIGCLSLVPPPFSEQTLEGLLAEMKEGRFGRIVRGKGLLQIGSKRWVNLQLVSGRATLEQLSSPVAPKLTLFGFDLRDQELRDYLASPQK